MTIAVKVAHPGASAAQRADAAKLLRNEVRALGRVQHTNVVRLLGACTEPPMLLMQLAPGGTLRELLDRSPPPSISASAGALTLTPFSMNWGLHVRFIYTSEVVVCFIPLLFAALGT